MRCQCLPPNVGFAGVTCGSIAVDIIDAIINVVFIVVFFVVSVLFIASFCPWFHFIVIYVVFVVAVSARRERSG